MQEVGVKRNEANKRAPQEKEHVIFLWLGIIIENPTKVSSVRFVTKLNLVIGSLRCSFFSRSLLA